MRKLIFTLALLVVTQFSFSQTGWNQQATNVTTSFLVACHFNDANNGWAVGLSGTIVHTSDGGSNWAQQSVMSVAELWDVQFLDNNTGWIVGSGPTLLATSDGGMNWNNSGMFPPFFNSGLLGVSFVDANMGWACGIAGAIVNTTDGGANWTEQSSSSTNNLNDIIFIDANNGWAVGASGTIVATTAVSYTHLTLPTMRTV